MAPREAFGISVSQLKARLRDHPCGAFVFYGVEELLKQFYLQKFVSLIEKEGMADFNLVKLDFSRDGDLSGLLDECQIVPFFGEKRLVIARGMNLLKLSAADVKRIGEMLESIPPYLILVIYMENEEMGSDKKTLEHKNVKALAEKGMDFVSFPLQEERVLLPWSRKILEADGLVASDAALRSLFRLSGNKMMGIRKELEKLSAYALYQKRGEVTEEDVALFAHDTSEFASYHLCEAVLEGAVGAAEKILSSLKQQEEEPILIAAALSKMLTVAMLIAQGADAAACNKVAKVAPWQVDRYRRSLFGKKKEDLEKALFLCLDLDRSLKGARSNAFLVLEKSVIQMARIIGGIK